MLAISSVLDLFPLSARVAGGELTLGGVGAEQLAAEHGTPLVVYCEETVRAQARAYRDAAPDALVVYGTKAFPSVALLRILAEEGVGADVSTLGELAVAAAAGIAGERILFHGNNKSDDELRGAAAAGATVVLDALDEPARAAAAGVRRAFVRLTPGVEAVTHQSIQTAHDESKFGLAADPALAVIAEARSLGIDIAGVHFHVGSQLARVDESLVAVERLAAFCERARAELDWTPEVLDIGGGLGIRYTRDEQVPEVGDFVGPLVRRLRERWPDPVQVVLEPGRSLVGRAGVTIYRVGVLKDSGGVRYAAIDGGMSDNPRPQLYGARYEALLANRADELPDGVFRIAGKHCESGDVLIDAAELPHPRRGDLLAVPATGAYTLTMGSNYNGVPRPAVVLVGDGEARVIRRRESLDDLLRYEER
ncbi:MAG: diaminopimelate decarboxylase [Gaiellaceae bacterium]|jgi:diaminopimelate decarboxylase|nr:diaminopimelate decarboxylase [Gaiellaceae bacterium]